LHWENQPGFVETFPDLQPSPNKLEIDADLMTCGGGAAATQMMLSLIASDYGYDFAMVVSDMCLNSVDITQNAKQRSSIARAISSRNGKLLLVMRAMYDNLEEPLSMAELAQASGLSRRQIERLFITYLAETPANVYKNIRLDRARALFAETDMSVAEVAAACGFSSADLLSRNYKARFGETPQGLRRR
jgi:transcriptional regulator GlxA family with amidase domain